MQAFKKGIMEASPVLLEPIATLEVTVPDEYTGDVMGDLNKRRGRVLLSLIHICSPLGIFNFSRIHILISVQFFRPRGAPAYPVEITSSFFTMTAP